MAENVRDRALRATIPVSNTTTLDSLREIAAIAVHLGDARVNPAAHADCRQCIEAIEYTAYLKHALDSWRQWHPWNP